MTSIFNVSTYKATRIRTMTRIVNLMIGLGLSGMIVAFPPVKTEWIAIGSILSILLILFAIVGLWPKLRISILGHVVNNTIVHTVVYFVVGMSVVMLVVYNPPVATTWYAFFSLVGAMMVFDAIFSMGYTLKTKKAAKEKEATDDNTPHLHKAA